MKHKIANARVLVPEDGGFRWYGVPTVVTRARSSSTIVRAILRTNPDAVSVRFHDPFICNGCAPGDPLPCEGWRTVEVNRG